jgi:hypothetical protein
VICRDNFKYEVADSSRRNGVNAHDLLALEEPKVRVFIKHTWVMGTLVVIRYNGVTRSYGTLGSYVTLGSYSTLGSYGTLGSYSTLGLYAEVGIDTCK